METRNAKSNPRGMETRTKKQTRISTHQEHCNTHEKHKSKKARHKHQEKCTKKQQANMRNRSKGTVRKHGDHATRHNKQACAARTKNQETQMSIKNASQEIINAIENQS